MRAAADLLRSRMPLGPRVWVVLGSGLGHVADELEGASSVPFEELPGFPAPGVVGHAGRLAWGKVDGVDVVFQSGRYHMYEGHAPDVIAAFVRTAAELGVEALVLTSSAGGLDPALEPGDLVLLTDHINAMFRSPLVGPLRERETRFPDMSEPYDAELRALALEVARGEGLRLKEGIYAGVLGPSYETAAEVRMLGRWGAHVVGMSTVPEVIAARARGLRCIALSVVTNKGTGLASHPLSHAEVVAVGREAGLRLGRLLARLIPRLARAVQSGSAK